METKMNTDKKALVVFHGPSCLDGMAAAWCMHEFLGDSAEYVVGRYQSDDQIDFTGRVVYLVDFSYPRKFMEENILPVAKMVYLIDHHKSALEELEGIERLWPNIDTTYTSNYKSGAMLAYHFVNARGGLLDAPLIDYIQDRDLWEFKFDDTKAITAALYALDLNYISIGNYMRLTSPIKTYLRNAGETLLMKQERDVEAIIKMGLRFVSATLFGHNEDIQVPICNAPPMVTSDVGNRLAKDYPFAVMYHDMQNTCDYSLRSSKENPKAVDVGALAKKLGGGGHKHAAGFKLPLRDVYMKYD